MSGTHQPAFRPRLAGLPTSAGTMPAPKSFGRDRGLQTRMLATMFLLGLVYVVLIAVLIAAGVGAVTVAVIAGALFLVQYFSSDKLALALDGRARGLRRRRPRSCTPRSSGSASRPTCRCRRWRSPTRRCPTRSPWALAEHRHRVRDHRAAGAAQPGRARGVLGPRADPRRQPRRDVDDDRQLLRLDRVVHRPVRLLLRRRLRRRNDRDDSNTRASSSSSSCPGIVYVVSFVLLQALSRYREFAADRGSAIITGRPSALASALMKIYEQMDQIPQRDLRAASGELAAFYIFPPKAKSDRGHAVLDPPAARGAPGRAGPATRPSSRAPPSGARTA